jgi:hypothetical protein
MVYPLQQPRTPYEVFYNISFEDLNIIDRLQDLWMQYVMWERSLLIAQAFDLPNLQAVLDRLYGIPLDFYNTLRVFYGDRIAQQMLNYLQQRIIIESRLIDAMIAGDQSTVDTYTTQLYQNADELASYFDQFPYWTAAQWKSLLYQDISMFFDEIRSILSEEYEREIEIFERMLINAASIGRYMAAGILQTSTRQSSQAVPTTQFR